MRKPSAAEAAAGTPDGSTPGWDVEIARRSRLRLALGILQGGPLGILIGLCVAMTFLSPFFLTERNLQNLGAQTSIIAALALGQLLVIVTRGVDVSVGSVTALSAVVGISVADSGLGSGAAVILAMLVVGGCVGLVNGLLIAKGRLAQPLIVTVATLGIVRGLAEMVTNGETRTGFPPAIITAGDGFVGPIPVPVLIVAGAALLLALLTQRTQWGRWLYALGGSPDAARQVGIPVDRVTLAAYVVCGATAGLAGIIIAGRTATASPLAGMSLELDAITAVIVGGASLAGGRGTVGNVLAGALILGVIRNGLDLLDVSPFMQLVAVGGIVIVSLELDAIRRRLEERFRAAQARRAR